MDSKILIHLFFIIGLATFSSCEKDADIPLPVDEPKLVVYSYISPTDSIVKVSVNSSDPIFDNVGQNSSGPIMNATVTIRVDGTNYVLPYHSTYLSYVLPASSLPIVAGKYYELEVSAPGFETVTASTTVPVNNNFNFTAVVTGSTPPVVNESIYDPRIYEVKANWTAYSSQDYYRCVLSYYEISPGSDTMFFLNYEQLFSEKDIVAGTITNDEKLRTNIYTEPYTNPHGIYADLIVSTFDYYKFYESIINYNPGDPFSEPTFVYSNIENGYGIFAGFLRIQKKIHY